MISIVVPAFNEGKRIENTLNTYCKFFRDRLEFEIIVVINNTSDNTLEVVKKCAEKNKEIRYLNLKEKGKGNAVKIGFKDALTRDSDLIGFVDADSSTSPEAFYDLIKNIGDYDGIIASRRMKDSKIKKTLSRTVISFTFNTIVRIMFWLPYCDTQAGAKIFKNEAIEKIVDELKTPGWVFDIEILYRLKKEGFQVLEYPTVWNDKEGGSITGNFIRTSLEMLYNLIKLRWNINEKKI